MYAADMEVAKAPRATLGAECVRTPPLGLAFERLDRSINILDALVAQLSERLEPVRSPRPQKQCEPTPHVSSGASAVTERLDLMSMAVERISDGIGVILEELEV